jgi:hypothetical protein
LFDFPLLEATIFFTKEREVYSDKAPPQGSAPAQNVTMSSVINAFLEASFVHGLRYLIGARRLGRVGDGRLFHLRLSHSKAVSGIRTIELVLILAK